MKAVVQRADGASVTVDGEKLGEIGKGLVVYLGVAKGDSRADAERLASKISALRIFPDSDMKMNLSVADIGGSVLAISQFTLIADTRKGNRPSYNDAAAPEEAVPLYEEFMSCLSEKGVPVEKGRFGAKMRVSYVNDGPVTIILDSKA